MEDPSKPNAEEVSEPTVEDLAAMLSGDKPFPGEEAEEEAVVADEAPEDAADDELVAESEETDDVEPEEEATEEVTADAPVDVELLRAELEELRAERERDKATTGRLGGELGFLRQQKQALEAQIQAGRQTQREAEPTDDYDMGHSAPVQQQAQPTRDLSADELRVQTMNVAAQEFAAAYPDSAQLDQATGEIKYTDEFAAQLQKLNIDMSVIAQAGPQTVRQITRSALEQARANVMVGRARAKREEIEKLRTASTDDVRKRKRAAAVPSVGTTARARPKRKQRTPQELSVDELKAGLEELAK